MSQQSTGRERVKESERREKEGERVRDCNRVAGIAHFSLYSQSNCGVLVVDSRCLECDSYPHARTHTHTHNTPTLIHAWIKHLLAWPNHMAETIDTRWNITMYTEHINKFAAIGNHTRGPTCTNNMVGVHEWTIEHQRVPHEYYVCVFYSGDSIAPAFVTRKQKKKKKIKRRQQR